MARDGSYAGRIADATSGMQRTAADTVSIDDVLLLEDQSAEPSTPTGGGVLFVQAGALKYKGSSGTVTTLGAA